MTRLRFPFTFQTQPARTARRPAAPLLALALAACLPFAAPTLPARAQDTNHTTDDKDKTDTTDTTRAPRDTADRTRDDRDKADKDKTDKDLTKDDAASKDKQGKPIYRPGRPPANPLVLIDPTGRGNNTNEFNKDGTRKEPKRQSPNFRDYRKDNNDPRTNQAAKKLPLFGYNLFREVRLAIQQKRAALLTDDLADPSTRRRRTTSSTNATRRRAANNANGNRTTDADNGSDMSRDDLTRDDLTRDDLTRDRTTRRSNTDDASSDNTDDNSDNTRNGESPHTRANNRDNQRDDTRDNTDNNGDNSDNATDRTDTRSRNADDNSRDDNGSSILDANGQVRLRKGRRDTGANGTDGDNTDDNTNGTSRLNSRSRTSGGSTSSRNRYNDDNMDDGLSTTRRRQLNGESSDNSEAGYAILTPLDQMRQNVSVTPPANYQLSSGDRVIIRIESPTLEPREIRSTVDAQGQIDVREEGIKPITVQGRSVGEAESLVKQRISRYYRGATVTLNLGKLRTIGVTVSGEAVLPGTFSVPAVTSAINVLFAAGGPTEQGSLRNIRVLRSGKGVGTIDIYKWIRGEQSDIRLQAGDTIYIPGAYGRVSLRGEVRNEALYEIRDGETLDDILRYADGVKSSAVEQNIQVSTLQPGAARILKTIDLRDAAKVKTLPLYDGDAISIASVRPIVTNKVTIAGAVEQPSDYPLAAGMKISDLVRDARGLLSEAYLGRAALHRWNPDGVDTHIAIDLDKALQGDPASDLTLVRWDRLEIYTQQEASFVGTRKVTVNGAVQRPGVQEFGVGMKLSDLLIKAGGPMPDAQQIVVLHQRGDGTYAYEYATVADVTHDTRKDIAVQDNDLVAVYRAGESQFTPDHLVAVRGAVQGEGVYPRGENMRLSELIRNAGGFKPGAGLEVKVAHARRPLEGPEGRMQVASVKFDDHQRCAPGEDLILQDGDVVTVQSIGGIPDHPYVVTIKGAVKSEGPIFITSKKMRLSDAIAAAGGLRPEAFPEGAELTRDAKNQGTETQRTLTTNIVTLNDLLNDKEYRRELAKSDVERIKAVNEASGSALSLSASSGANGAGTAVAAAVANQLATHDLVGTPRRLTERELNPYGAVKIDLPLAMKKPGSLDDLIVMDGDVINVPEEPTTVSVVGAVFNGRAVPYRKSADLSYYVAQAGDYTADAQKGSVEVIHAGGGLSPASKVKEIRPGDVIVVPTKVLAAKISSDRGGFDGFFRSLTSSALTFGLASKLFGF